MAPKQKSSESTNPPISRRNLREHDRYQAEQSLLVRLGFCAMTHRDDGPSAAWALYLGVAPE